MALSACAASAGRAWRHRAHLCEPLFPAASVQPCRHHVDEMGRSAIGRHRSASSRTGPVRCSPQSNRLPSCATGLRISGSSRRSTRAGGTQLIRVQAGFYLGTATFVATDRRFTDACKPPSPSSITSCTASRCWLCREGTFPGIVDARASDSKRWKICAACACERPRSCSACSKTLERIRVDMPMGEVYSALAKGVLDGVVAPADTLRSLHFAEVAHYFNTIRIPRGAYAARAMGEERWNQLTPPNRPCSSEASPCGKTHWPLKSCTAEHRGCTSGSRARRRVFRHAAKPTSSASTHLRARRRAARAGAGAIRHRRDGELSPRARDCQRRCGDSGKIQCEKGNDRETA